MQSTTIKQAKRDLSALIDLVGAGESIVITDRGQPVARLEPVSSAYDESGRLLRLERAGIVRVGRGTPPVDLIRQTPPRLANQASAVDALLDERHYGR